ncbi:uncharacterized protein BDV17DRAFT_287141 [Aspergillus undulatus]|uniref:uncharacterized protein n=1 Tax=Aspergillus undulatus TaxID=1810928 RepID=UPI003CCD75E8
MLDFGEIVQIAPARMIAQTLTKNKNSNSTSGDAPAPVYWYRFNHLRSDTGTDGSDITAGIGTGIEQRYVFSNLLPDLPWDRALAYEISSAWVSFYMGWIRMLVVPHSTHNSQR